MIEPRILSGFRDYPPRLAVPRERLMEQARTVFRSYGFAPIDTPALELSEVLLANIGGGEEVHKQLYRFRDNGDRDVALRFDLTVPLARFAAMHVTRPEIGTPFKRYHIAPVWRGESPQAGRFREFVQCDFDTIGTTSNAADIETALVIHDLLARLGFERFTIRLNNRLILNGLLADLGLTDRAALILRALDKLPKIGSDKVIAELTDTAAERAGLSLDQARQVLALTALTGSNTEILDQLEHRFGGNALTSDGIARLRQLLSVATQAGIAAERLRVDVSICRGLGYYTGTVFETFLDDLPQIGSVCSGGRYNHLASHYTRQELPGVGASLGLDRLLAAMEQLKLLPESATFAAVLIVQFDADHLGDYQRLGRTLRQAGIGAEVFADAKKIGQQLQYAEKRGFRLALIAGPDEFARGEVKLKHLARRQEQTVAQTALIDAVLDLLRD